MKNSLRRLRGVIGTGLTWAVGWALGGLLIGATSILLPWLPWDAFFEVFDAPLPALAVPGFVGGVIFSTVLMVAARRRRLEELSLPAFTALGALGGLLLSLVPAAMVATGLASLGRHDLSLWNITATISGPLILLSAVSAAMTLKLATMGNGRHMLPRSNDSAEPALTEGQARERFGEPQRARQPGR